MNANRREWEESKMRPDKLHHQSLLVWLLVQSVAQPVQHFNRRTDDLVNLLFVNRISSLFAFIGVYSRLNQFLLAWRAVVGEVDKVDNPTQPCLQSYQGWSNSFAANANDRFFQRPNG